MLRHEILELARDLDIGTPGYANTVEECDQLIVFARQVQANTLKHILPLSAGKGIESFRQEILGLIASTENEIEALSDDVKD